MAVRAATGDEEDAESTGLFTVCTLTAGKTDQQVLDLKFSTGVSFELVSGNGPISLTGYCTMMSGDDMELYGESPARTRQAP